MPRTSVFIYQSVTHLVTNLLISDDKLVIHFACLIQHLLLTWTHNSSADEADKLLFACSDPFAWQTVQWEY